MNETLVKNKVKVRRIVYHNPTSNWGVFTYINDNSIPELTDTEVKVSGNFPNLTEGLEVSITGEIITHPKYGLQINLKECKVNDDSNFKKGIVEFLAKSSIKGIDARNALKIYNKFGKDSIRVVLNEPEKLTEINGIGEGTVAVIRCSTLEYLTQEEFINFCIEMGNINFSTMSKIQKVLKENIVEKLKANPYRLLTIDSVFTFKQVDDIALKLEFPLDSDYRLKSGLLYVLHREATFRGSTGCSSQELQRMFLKELGLKDNSLYQYTLNLLETEGCIKVEYNRVYFSKFYEAELNIADFLHLCKGNKSLRTYNRVAVEEEINNFPFKLNEQQVKAIKSCLANQFSVLTSLAGGGKSTITKAIVNILKRHEENVILLSPTGKAAKRLSECTNMQAQTVHRFLGVKDSVEKAEPDLIDFKTTVIVDEASMLDVLLFEKLISCTNDDTRLILVGDTHQLPSVQAGNVLGDIINSGNYNVCVLTDIMRQAEGSSIIKYCSKVNNNELFDPVKTKDFVYLNFNKRKTLLEFLLRNYKKAVEVYGLQETQVLCAYKLGLLGMNNLNEKLKATVNNKISPFSFGFSVGDKVRHTKNNYQKGVFNGETGVVSNINLADRYDEFSEDTLEVDFDDKEVEYNKKDIYELQLAYASTVHASQGSEYKVVFVVLDNEVSNILLSRKILYTALSRAKVKCVLLSTGNCVNTAINNDYYRERITKLEEFLKGDINDLNFD